MIDAGKNSHAPPHWLAILEIALVFGVFFLHGAWPTPDHNETHYLSKAAHFWNPEAFAGDFFCNTADAHDVFYFAIGWLTLWLPLDAVAWIGRCLTWLLLAIAWRGLSAAVVPRPWISVLSAALLMLLTENAHMAGEWMVGGVEAKGFAYALALFGLHALVRGRWNLVWIALGAATLLHAVVGGWAAICAAAVWLINRQERPALSTMLPGLIAGLLLAIPSLWFGASLNWNVDAPTLQQAANIQVYERLAHHLAPNTFQTGFISRHLLLWTLFFFLCSVTPTGTSDRRLRWFVAMTMILALAGFALGCLASLAPDFSARWLRFYWLRLSDVIVPLGVTLVGLQFLLQLSRTHVVRARWWLAGLLVLCVIDLVKHSAHVPGIAQQVGIAPRSDKMVAYDDWREACAWAAANTPPGTRFITPRLSNTFKWYSGRDEIVTWKDMPQDAASVVQWWQRSGDVFGTGSDDPDLRWHSTLAEIGPQRLQAVAKKYNAQYAIVDLAPDTPRLPLTPVFETTNHAYAIYKLD